MIIWFDDKGVWLWLSYRLICRTTNEFLRTPFHAWLIRPKGVLISTLLFMSQHDCIDYNNKASYLMNQSSSFFLSVSKSFWKSSTHSSSSYIVRLFNFNYRWHVGLVKSCSIINNNNNDPKNWVYCTYDKVFCIYSYVCTSSSTIGIRYQVSIISVISLDSSLKSIRYYGGRTNLISTVLLARIDFFMANDDWSRSSEWLQRRHVSISPWNLSKTFNFVIMNGIRFLKNVCFYVYFWLLQLIDYRVLASCSCRITFLIQ